MKFKKAIEVLKEEAILVSSDIDKVLSQDFIDRMNDKSKTNRASQLSSVRAKFKGFLTKRLGEVSKKSNSVKQFRKEIGSVSADLTSFKKKLSEIKSIEKTEEQKVRRARVRKKESKDASELGKYATRPNKNNLAQVQNSNKKKKGKIGKFIDKISRNSNKPSLPSKMDSKY